MTLIERGGRVGVKVWDPTIRRYRWIGTYNSRERAVVAEATAQQGLPTLPDDENDASPHVVLTGSVVYFVSAPELALVKIGFTEDFSKRLVGLRHGSPVDLRVLAAVPGTTETERQYHERFSLYRVRREWFRIAGDLAEYITHLQTGRHWEVLEGGEEDAA